MDSTTGRAAKSQRRHRVELRRLSRGEQIADAWVNGLAIVAGLAGVVVLLAVAIPRGDPVRTLSLIVYSGGLLAMLFASALYNATTSPGRKDLLRRIDHAAIFVMIAGTYTPFLAVKLDGAWSRWLLVYVWVVAGTGVVLKLIWVNHFARLSVLLYLFLGWTAVIAIAPLLAAMSSTAMILLGVGGALYTLGVVFHLWERLPYSQPVWHGFVFAAAACHYAAVIGEVALPGRFP